MRSFSSFFFFSLPTLILFFFLSQGHFFFLKEKPRKLKRKKRKKKTKLQSHFGNTIINNTETIGVRKERKSRLLSGRLSFKAKKYQFILTGTEKNRNEKERDNPKKIVVAVTITYFAGLTETSHIYICTYRYIYRIIPKRNRCTGIVCFIENKKKERSKVRQI